MKRFVLAFFFVAISSATVVSAHGQSSASAFHRSYNLDVGAEGSGFQPDYAGNGFAQTSPQRLYGIGAYADARFSRWAQLEAEGRWLYFNEYLGISQATYSVGPRIPIVEDFHKFTPYGKVLLGLGNMTNLSGSAFMVTFGGGLDYRLNNRFTVRAFDFEYQRWTVSPDTVWPYGGSVGLSYRIF